MNATSCACRCKHGWSGEVCDDCRKICIHNGTLDKTSCKCRCPTGWAGEYCHINDCSKMCHHGTLDTNTCRCKCPDHWRGELCQTGDCRKTCMNGGTLDKGNCQCRCAAGWNGDMCHVPGCNKTCKNGGTRNPNNCRCSCPSRWAGDTCENDCNSKCEHGGIMLIGSCVCRCPSGWTGRLCDTSAVLNCYIVVNGVAVYRGTHNVAKSGFTCQQWATTRPIHHRYKDKHFSNTDGFPEKAAHASNYCRDPSRRQTFSSNNIMKRWRPKGKPWCLNSGGKPPKWDYCDIPRCVHSL